MAAEQRADDGSLYTLPLGSKEVRMGRM